MDISNFSKMILQVEKEIQAAVLSQRDLTAHLTTAFETLKVQVFDAKNYGHSIEPPTSALRLLVNILTELTNGNAAQLIPIHLELTTQEAADLLNVSNPHLAKLLKEGALPFHKTGKHRRVRLTDIMAFKTERTLKSEHALQALAKQAQELNMGYK